MDLLDRLLGHDHWATAQILEKSRNLTDAQLDQPFDIGHSSLRETLHHLVYVINFWTSQMEGRPVKRRHEGKPAIADLIEFHEHYHAAYAECARRMRSEERLDETFFDHYDFPQSMGATILQVYHHNAQHRAEARHMLERLGVPRLVGLRPPGVGARDGIVPNVTRDGRVHDMGGNEGQ